MGLAVRKPRPPMSRPAVRKGHDAIIDAVREGHAFKAQALLERMPADYRIAVAVCTFAAKFAGGKPRQRSRGEVLGIDQKATFNKWLKATFQHLDESRERTRAEHAAQARAAQYGVRETIYLRVVKRQLPDGKGRRVWTYYGHSIAGMPVDGMSIEINMMEPDGISELLHEARFLYCQCLLKEGLEKDRLKAAERAGRAVFELADVEVQ